jgi:hypothetical protein
MTCRHRAHCADAVAQFTTVVNAKREVGWGRAPNLEAASRDLESGTYGSCQEIVLVSRHLVIYALDGNAVWEAGRSSGRLG